MDPQSTATILPPSKGKNNTTTKGGGNSKFKPIHILNSSCTSTPYAIGAKKGYHYIKRLRYKRSFDTFNQVSFYPPQMIMVSTSAVTPVKWPALHSATQKERVYESLNKHKMKVPLNLLSDKSAPGKLGRVHKMSCTTIGLEEAIQAGQGVNMPNDLKSKV
jgi:hypothetical protein